MIDLDSYQWLRIEPADAWFFRDGRPCNRGEDQGDVESEFPPNSTTVVGALRAALARENGWAGYGSWADQSTQLKRVLGDGFEDLGQLRFLGPFLCKQMEVSGGRTLREELLWPLPQHVVGRFEDGRFVPLDLMEPSPEVVCCDVHPGGVQLAAPRMSTRGAVVHHEMRSQKPPSHPSDVFVTTAGLNTILQGEVPSATECFLREDLYTHEARVGIRREPVTRTTGGGDIYHPRYVRLRPDVWLVEGVAGVPEDWAWPRVMPLGGESRMALVSRLDEPPSFPVGRSGSAAMVIALSPVRFPLEWWGAGPGDSASRLSERLAGHVRCVALDRPRLIGGWDFQSGPRPLSPFVAPGTVWWLSNSTTETNLAQFGTNTTYGYGLVAIGAI